MIKLIVALFFILQLSCCATTSLLDLGYDRTVVYECGQFKESTSGPRNPWAFVAIIPCYPLALTFDLVTYPIQYYLDTPHSKP